MAAAATSIRMTMSSPPAMVAVLLVVAVLMCSILPSGCAAGGLDIDYYNTTCPDVEKIVRAETTRMVRSSPDLAAAFLRLHYHDCFVQGCDASVLLDSTPENTAEKDAMPNGSLRGFDSVAHVKAQLEQACPGIVSCADILALMARDAVALARGPSWAVELGRRDGRTSSAGNCGELPPLQGDVNLMIEAFAAKGLDVKDLVVLSGAHTLGKAHCPTFSDRLYSGGTTNNCSTDPKLDARYADRLRMRCTSPSSSSSSSSAAAAELDPGSCARFDTSYYRHVARRRGLLRSDACLLDHRFTRAYVLQAASGRYDGHFFLDFAESMAKMASIGVLTGDQGEIRKQCNVVN